MTTKYKYLNKEYLDRINHISRDVMKYNRSLPQELIDRLPEERFYIITFSMLHEHIAGKPAEPHVRCLIYGGPDVPNPMILDMEMGLYDILPEVEAKEKDEEPEPATAG